MSCKSLVFALLLMLSPAASAQPATSAAQSAALRCGAVPVAPAVAWQRVGAPAHPHA